MKLELNAYWQKKKIWHDWTDQETKINDTDGICNILRVP